MAADSFNVTGHFLDRHIAEGRGEKTAIRCQGRTFSYAEVLAMVNRAGNGLRARGVGPGDRVLIALADSPEFAAAYFGAMRIGAVAVPTSTYLRAADYAYCLQESEAKAVIAHSATCLRAEGAIMAGEPEQGCIRWEDWIAAQPPVLAATPTPRDEIAFWLWTSGSTGPPKAAIHRHGDWLHCAMGYADGVLGIGPDDVTFSSSKLFHAYGLGNGLMFPFHAGATTVLFPGRPQARAILEEAAAARPTLFFSVPTLFAAMLQEPGWYDLSSARLGISAAEPLPAEIERRWRERFGFEVLDGIGSTEVLHIYLSARPGRIKPGSTGTPVPGYRVRITDEGGREVAPNQIGDLWVQGESVASGYWKRPELSAERMHAGWFFSGDKFYRDADSSYWYAGRSDDMFRASGEWVSPVEVESVLIAHPAVLEAAVVAFCDEHELLKPMAFVVLKTGVAAADGLAAELHQFLRDRLPRYKCPQRIRFLEELPKTATGKIQRYKLRSA